MDIRSTIIGISGTSSNCGKTTMLCDLLRKLSRDGDWEAIKLTRGHYRSCGKDPHACCVSEMLSDQPVIRSGRDRTFAHGKDTGSYWDAGAKNVHWVIVTNDQVEQGIKQALERVQSRGVLIEGTSFLKFIKPDLSLLVVRPGAGKIKPSARNAITGEMIDGIYLSGSDSGEALKSRFSTSFISESGLTVSPEYLSGIPLYTQSDLSGLAERILTIT